MTVSAARGKQPCARAGQAYDVSPARVTVQASLSAAKELEAPQLAKEIEAPQQPCARAGQA